MKPIIKLITNLENPSKVDLRKILEETGAPPEILTMFDNGEISVEVKSVDLDNIDPRELVDLMKAAMPPEILEIMNQLEEIFNKEGLTPKIIHAKALLDNSGPDAATRFIAEQWPDSQRSKHWNVNTDLNTIHNSQFSAC